MKGKELSDTEVRRLSNIIEQPDLNLELLFCTEVLKLGSLHYGLWEEHKDLTLNNLRQAQKRYTQTLLKMIPGQVNTVLDVGCGIGDVSRALAEKGYEVTSISPDQKHKKFFNSEEKITFHTSSAEDFNVPKKFDLVLMCESQNYFHPDTGFKLCERQLNKGGHLLVSGMFTKGENASFLYFMTSEDRYTRMAEQFNLSLIDSKDITMQILPSLELANRAYTEYLIPSLGVLLHFFERSASFRLKVLRLLFSKEFKLLSDAQKYAETRLNPTWFEKNIEYKRLLFSFS